MPIKWPTEQQDFIRWAEALGDLVGGRRDVAARHAQWNDRETGRPVAIWGPWKGERVPADYEPKPGELVHEFNIRGGGTERRIIKPLSSSNLVGHLRGRDRLGVYVLDADSRCSFLAADFDDHGGKLEPAAVWAEVRTFVETCETHDWIVHTERSKSGRGYHVWLFFDSPVDAAKARAIGRWLFEESQLLRDDEDFSTFDRFFPAQSELPPKSKGFGNLIGLPCFGFREYESGRTAWCDSQGATIDDAMGYTLGILAQGRNRAERVDQFMAEWDLQPEFRKYEERRERERGGEIGTPEEWEHVTGRCGFVQWASDPSHQAAVAEPLWFSMISNACRFDVDEWIHDASRHYPGYSSAETDSKIAHARGGAGPQTCETIRANGYKGCPEGGCELPNGRATAAPAGLAAWIRARGREGSKKTRDRSVHVSAKDTAAAASTPEDIYADLPVNEETGEPWPPLMSPWKIGGLGVEDGKKDEAITLRPIWVEALTESFYGQPGVYVCFFDARFRPVKQAFPARRLHEQAGLLASDLADMGFMTVPGKEKWLARYLAIHAAVCKTWIFATPRLGWMESDENNPVFVLPEQIIGQPSQPIVYQPDVINVAMLSRTLHRKGGLQKWQRGVADRCRGNPLLMFSLMVGLTGPLLWFCEEQSGGFHFYGTTSGGKTTAAQVAASVWGSGADPQAGPEFTSIRKWNATSAALEGMAELHNHMVLVLDEISEVEPHELGRIIYQLAGGLSKGRGAASGGLRAMKSWRFLFLSTGEKSVRQILGQVGQDVKGGQRVRLPDIPVDNNDGTRAIISDSQGETAKDFVQGLKSSCAASYGLAGPVFVAALIAQSHQVGVATLSGELRRQLAKLELSFADKAGELPAELLRVLRRFALVALAGIRAADAGVIDWTVDEIYNAVCFVRDRWLAEQGEERSEVERGLAHLRNEMLANMFRFHDVEHKGRGNSQEIIGFSTQEWFLLTQKGFRQLCGEFDPTVLLHALKRDDFLWSDSDRLTRKSPKIEALGHSRPYLYWIDKRFVGEVIKDPTDEDKAAGIRQVEGDPF